MPNAANGVPAAEASRSAATRTAGLKSRHVFPVASFALHSAMADADVGREASMRVCEYVRTLAGQHLRRWASHALFDQRVQLGLSHLASGLLAGCRAVVSRSRRRGWRLFAIRRYLLKQANFFQALIVGHGRNFAS